MSGPGWQQPQQPPHYPPGWHPQQQQQQPYPPPPKKKSKAPKIIVITAVVLLLLAGAGLAAWRFIYISGDAGADPATGAPPPECAVDAKTLETANVAAFTGGRTEGQTTSCSYASRKGGDGATVRTVTITVRKLADEGTKNDDEIFDFYIAEQNPTYSVKPGPELGDKAQYYFHEQNGHTYLTLGVRKGSTLYKLGFYGYTKGFFGDSAAPVGQAEKDLAAMAAALVK